jgi:2-methylisocitrate lyase-like PEP mutase family enzyme
MIRELVAHLDGVPLNLLAGGTDLSVGELCALGVRRLSVGSALYRLGMAAVCEAMGELLSSGRQDALAGAQGLTYAELARTLALGATAGEDV